MAQLQRPVLEGVEQPQQSPAQQQPQQQDQQQADEAGARHDGEEPPPPQQPSPCGVCDQQPYKYRCPGCSVRSCSVECVRRHKDDTGCSGKRDRLAFVPLSEFGDRELVSDYKLLEEVSRADDNARRHRPPAPRPQLPQALSGLIQQARLRGVRLMIMPPGMQRRRDSTTYYNFRARKLLWRVEWVFPEADPEAAAAAQAQAQQQQEQQQQQQQHRQQHPQRWQPQQRPGPASPVSAAQAKEPAAAAGGRGLVLVDARVDEERPLRPLLEAHLANAPGAGARQLALRAYVEAVAARGGDAGALPVLMRQEHCPANAPRYYKLDVDASLRSQLAGKAIIEFPTLIVLLPGQEGSERYPLVPAAEAAEEVGGGRVDGEAGRPAKAARHAGAPQLALRYPPPPPPPRVNGAQQQQAQQQQQQQQQAQENDQEQQEQQ